MRPTRREFLATTGAATAGAAAATASVGAVAGCIGTPADVTTLRSLDVAGSPGGQVPVRKPGTVSLVDFFATWCAPCKPQMGNLNHVRSRFDKAELYVTSVTTERDESAVRRFWRRYDGNWPVLLDPELTATQAFEVKGVPTLVLLDGDGEVVWRHRGLAGKESLREHIRRTNEG